MNATVQTMRAIPELHTALASYQPGSSSASGALGGGLDGSPLLTRSMRDMYAAMKSTMDPFTPIAFLSTLRQVVPQFGEMARESKNGPGGYAQQGTCFEWNRVICHVLTKHWTIDAEECWVQITNALNALPGLPDAEEETDMPTAIQSRKKFVEQYMMGEMRRE